MGWGLAVVVVVGICGAGVVVDVDVVGDGVDVDVGGWVEVLVAWVGGSGVVVEVVVVDVVDIVVVAFTILAGVVVETTAVRLSLDSVVDSSDTARVDDGMTSFSVTATGSVNNLS